MSLEDDALKHQRQGLRSRIMTPAPPAPVPDQKPRTVSTSSTDDRSLLNASSLSRIPVRTSTPEPAKATGGEESQTGATDQDSSTTSDADMIRSTGSMAFATLLSRITGFIRTAMIGAALGPAVGSAFTTANTLPNLITEIVLGAVLSSLVVPVLVRAEKEDPDRGQAFIRRLFTLSATLLIIVTVAAVIGAGFLTRILLREDGETNVVQATSFAYLLLPQIFFYGVFSLFMAILNTKEIFKPGAWAPVANNVVSIAVLAIYMVLPGSLDPNAPSGVLDKHVLLLGIGTTLGVVTQALIMLPYLHKAGINLRPLWGLDARLKQFGGMAAAIIAYVAISQFGYAIATRIASSSWKPAIIIYSNHWLLLQVPYGLIGVTLLTAIMPRLSKNAADGNDTAVIEDLTIAAKLTLVAIVPIVFFMTFFGSDIAIALFVFGNFHGEEADVLGLTVEFSAFTLIPYALVLLHLRVFYAREEAWTPTWIIAGITATKVLLSYIAPLIATKPQAVVVLLAAANGFGFLTGAVVGALLLRRRLGNVGGGPVAKTFVWASAASLIGIAATSGLNFLLQGYGADALSSLSKVGQFVHVAILALVFLIVTGLVLSRSGLPEVATLGAVLGRLPGMNRILKTANATESPADTKGTDTSESSPPVLPQPATPPVQTDIAALDAWGMSPVLPPMSGGQVRPPRQVAGAPVASGRFRLLAKQGSTSTASFWQAQELATGRMVSATFVDTVADTEDPFAVSKETSRERTHALEARTTLLGTINHPGIASGIEVLPYRLGALIIANWVEGSSLKTATAKGVNPRAAALALSPLVDAMAAMHDQSAALGLSDPAQIRISTGGVATVAFPMVTADATAIDDQHGLRSVVDYIAGAESDTDNRSLTQLLGDYDNLHEAARRLEKAGLGETLHISQEPVPTNVPSRGGFGGKNSNRATAIIFASASVFVIILALVVAYIVGVIGTGENSPSVPINPSVILPKETTETTTPAPTPQPQPLAQTLDSTTLLPGDEAVDGTASTTWTGSSLELGFRDTLILSSLTLTTSGSQGIYLQLLSNTPNLLPPEGATLRESDSTVEIPKDIPVSLASAQTTAPTQESSTITEPASSSTQVSLTAPGTVVWEGYITDDSMTLTLDNPAVLNGVWLSFGAPVTVADTSVSAIALNELMVSASAEPTAEESSDGDSLSNNEQIL